MVETVDAVHGIDGAENMSNEIAGTVNADDAIDMEVLSVAFGIPLQLPENDSWIKQGGRKPPSFVANCKPAAPANRLSCRPDPYRPPPFHHRQVPDPCKKAHKLSTHWSGITACRKRCS